MSPDPRAERSYLYVPGSRPDRFDKARTSGADVVLLDLEDAVAANAKEHARASVSAYAQQLPADCDDVHIRINDSRSSNLRADLLAAVWPGISTIRMPKAESAAQVIALDEELMAIEAQRGIEPGAIRLTLLIESAIGALNAEAMVASSPRVSSVAFGSSDFLADIGAAGDDALATLHVRSNLVLVCRAHGLLAPIDSVTTAIEDTDAVRREAEFARGLGFFGKSLIHPRQVAPAHEVFTPNESEIARAESVIALADGAQQTGTGALLHDGEFIDQAIVARSRALLAIRRTKE